MSTSPDFDKSYAAPVMANDVTADPEPAFKVETKTEARETNTDDDSQTSEVEYPKGFQLTFIAIALALALFLIALDMTIIATAIPKITDEFQGLDKVGWYSSAFFVTIGSFQSCWGKVYKYFPLKISFLAAIFLFEIGSAICGAAPNSNALIVGRAIAGVGGAGVSAGSYTIIAYSASPERRPMLLGLLGISYGFANVIGPLVGGIFSDKVTWRWCFYINLPVGAISIAIITFFFSDPPQAKPARVPLKEKLLQMDLVGVALLIAATICFVLGVEYGQGKYSWGSSKVIGLLVGFVLILFVWAANEWWMGERAMIVPRIIRDRTNLVMSGVAIAIGGSFFPVVYYVPIYFQSIDHATPIMSGVRNLPMVIAVTFGIFLAGGLISKTGRYQHILLFALGLSTVGAGLIYTFDLHTSTGKWIGYQIVAGVGWGLAYQIPLTVGQGSCDPMDMALITSNILFFQSYGASLFMSAAQAAFVDQMTAKVMELSDTISKDLLVLTGATDIYNVFKGDELADVLAGYMHGLKVVYAMAIGTIGLGFLIALAMPWKKLKQGQATGGA
ncbi:major facilitator superfamily transporter [Fusarium sporotrichioides]|uniref:Major facilitator superfamily transporter n=1 Tax=Fusarium sporotrichioides TaxID=5514 RepID=A0A395RW56_FUSSP|nr:major facilitator superfamily transporter [Fusarium sporotrichioides]